MDLSLHLDVLGLLRAGILAGLAGLAGPAACAALHQPPPSGWPAEAAETWTLLENKCSRCHPVSRITQAQKPPAQWKRTVERMARKLGAGITKGEAARIGEALAAWAEGQGISDSGGPAPERP